MASTPDAPMPLLRLALDRIASHRRSMVRLNGVRSAQRVAPGRWRWDLRACFFPRGNSRGSCSDMVMETDFMGDAAVPPTQWPFRVLSDVPVEGAAPFTDRLLLLSNRVTIGA